MRISLSQCSENDARRPLLTANAVLAASTSVLAVLLLVMRGPWPSHWRQKDHATFYELSKTSDAAYADVEVVGSERFQRQIRAALTLLMYKDQDGYLMVKKYLRRIKEANHSGTQVHEIPATFYFAPQSALHSLTWCAGDLVHEAYHCKLYRDYVGNHGSPVPAEVYGGKEAEKQCIKQQVATLEKIGGSMRELLSLKGPIGSYYMVPYSNRNW